MKHCDPEAISLLALGETPAPQDAVHLLTCDECRREWEDLCRVVDRARQAENDELLAPPAHIWAAIAEEISEPSVVTGLPARPSRRWAPWIAVAATVGLLFGGIAGVTLTRSSAPAPAIVASTPLSPLDEYTASGNATVEVVDGTEQLAVDVRGLPATDGYFEVWLLAPDASSMIAVGTLGAGQTSSFPLPPGVSLADYPVVDISVEDYDGDPTHSAISVARGTLPA